MLCAEGEVLVEYAGGSYATENDWSIVDCEGNTLASMEDGAGFSECVLLTDVYTVNMFDSFGDGWDHTYSVTGYIYIDGTPFTLESGSEGSETAGGSCPVFGCTDPSAANYNPLADTEDQSCVYGIGGLSLIHI